MADPTGRLYLQVLVVRCQLGDRAAFTEVVSICQPRLRAYLHEMLSESHHVDDVAQDVWMDVVRDLPNLVDPRAFLAWLYRIAHNRAARMMRRRHPMASLEDVEGAEGIEEETELTAEDAEAVHAGLAQLSEPHREVLLLRFLEDMSYEEISAVLDCPVGTVRSRIHNAKRALKDILEQARQP